MQAVVACDEQRDAGNEELAENPHSSASLDRNDERVYARTRLGAAFFSHFRAL
jgi:hypothetical protein